MQDLEQCDDRPPAGDAQQLGLDAQLGGARGCGAHGVEILLVRERGRLRTEQGDRRRVVAQLQQVHQDQRRTSLERAVDRHALRAGVRPHRQRGEHHRPHASGRRLGPNRGRRLTRQIHEVSLKSGRASAYPSTIVVEQLRAPACRLRRLEPRRPGGLGGAAPPGGPDRDLRPVPDLASEYRGHEGARKFWRQMYEPWETFHIDVEHVEDEGDCALASIRFGGRGADSGVDVDMRFGMLMRVRDGLAVELVNRRTFDQARKALRNGPTSRRARSGRARASRSGSASASIATILPSATVKPMTENGRPARRHDDAGGAVDERRAHERREARERERPPATASRAVHHARRARARARRRRSAARRPGRAPRRARRSRRRARRRRTRRRPRAGAARSASGAGACALHPAARPAGELARRGRRAADDRRDLVERHREHVVQHERQPLGGRRASRARPAARGRPSRPAAPRARGRARRRGSRSGRARGRSSGSSRRVRRERSMFRHTRPTTVVSQPPRFSISRGVGAAQPQPGLLHRVVGLARPSRASGRRPPAGGCGAPRTAPPASRARPSVTSLRRRGVKGVTDRDATDVTGGTNDDEDRRDRSDRAASGATSSTCSRTRATRSSRSPARRAWT